VGAPRSSTLVFKVVPDLSSRLNALARSIIDHGENPQAVAHLYYASSMLCFTAAPDLIGNCPSPHRFEEVVCASFSGRQHIEVGKRVVPDQDVGMNHQRARDPTPGACRPESSRG